MTRIVDRVYDLAEAKGLSMSQLCRDAGASHGSLSTARSNPDKDLGLDMVRKLAPVLGVTVAELIGEEPAAAPADPAGIRRIGLLRIQRSALNPRKHFDADAIRELADSIASKGLLQNLVVRRAPGVDDDADLYVIVAGERRFRALEILANENRTPPEIRDHGIPCRVIEADDAEHVAMAILENLQRQDVNPMEEADAFAQLQALDPAKYSTKAIAESIGCTPRHIQQRLALVSRLGIEAQEALRTGEINVTQARALGLVPPSRQRQALADGMHKRYATADDFQHALTHHWIETELAIFDVDAYATKYPEKVHTDEEGRRWFTDPDHFKSLQKNIMIQQVSEIPRGAPGFAFVEVFGDGMTDRKFYQGEWVPAEPPEAGVVYVWEGWSGRVTIHRNIKPKPVQKSAARKAEEEARRQLIAEREAAYAAWKADFLGAIDRAGLTAMIHLLLLNHLVQQKGDYSGTDTFLEHPAKGLPAAVMGPTLKAVTRNGETGMRCASPAADPAVVWEALQGEIFTDEDVEKHLLGWLAYRLRTRSHEPINRWLATVSRDYGVEIPAVLLPEGQADIEDAANAVRPDAGKRPGSQCQPGPALPPGTVVV